MQKQITQAAITEILRGIKGAKFATITMETEQDMRKTDNPFHGRVMKRSTVNVTMNANYKNSVSKALKKAGFSKATTENVVVAERTWGERLGNSCFVMHKGHLYLSAKLNAKPTKVQYFLDGQQMSPEDIKQMNTFIAAKRPQPVPVVAIRMENIKEVKVGGHHYIVGA